MEPDDRTTQRAFLSGAPHSGRATWWIPAPNGNQGCNSPGSVLGPLIAMATAPQVAFLSQF